MKKLTEQQVAERRRGELGREVDDFKEKLANNRNDMGEITRAYWAGATKSDAHIQQLKDEIATIKKAAKEDLDAFVHGSEKLHKYHAELLTAIGDHDGHATESEEDSV